MLRWKYCWVISPAGCTYETHGTLQIRWVTALPNVGSNINSLNYWATLNQCCIKFAQLTLFAFLMSYWVNYCQWLVKFCP